MIDRRPDAATVGAKHSQVETQLVEHFDREVSSINRKLKAKTPAPASSETKQAALTKHKGHADVFVRRKGSVQSAKCSEVDGRQEPGQTQKNQEPKDG